MFKHIFLALDDSAGAHRALEEALRLAVSMQAAVTAVCVVVHAARLVDVDAGFPDAEPDLPPGVELATAVLAEARARFAAAGVAGEVRAVDAYGEEVAAVLLRTAAESEADLIVMGTHGLHGWRRLLAGSVAESLLRGADRPVLMLHADERAAFAADAVAARAGRQPERRV
ncbi:universal stress protein [Burkholderia gladioli]|uniref:universal stress protein n=1 Tax=Burkholderia gladioli TaxID=28095 RepID=UPI001640AD02|nr:universal stress protein [Burkholderia gladioli]